MKIFIKKIENRMFSFVFVLAMVLTTFLNRQNVNGQTITKVCQNATYTYTPSTYNVDFSTALAGVNCLPSGYTPATMWGNQNNIVNPGIGNFTITFATPVTQFDFFAGAFDGGNNEYLQLISVDNGVGSLTALSTGTNCVGNMAPNKVGTATETGNAGVIRLSSTLPMTSATIYAFSSNPLGIYIPISCVQNPPLSCPAGTIAPILSGTLLTNSCPTATVDLNSLVTSLTPSGASLVWFTNNAHIGTAITMPTNTAGTYYAFYYDAVNNCYSPASATVTATINPCTVVGAGIIDCSKTMIISAPVAGTASQNTLVVTVNVTAAGSFPLTISGSGMGLANDVTSVTATSTGIQTFHIPLKYDGSALGTLNFTVGAAGSCSADLTSASAKKKVHVDVWTLDNCTFKVASPTLN